ncbi:MAG: hypothetical protein JXR81_06635 [Candidatus Goldbacteria bacterium]|nr:hypothetical protein [Candidatus Goldiibacteriota bacterium]
MSGKLIFNNKSLWMICFFVLCVISAYCGEIGFFEELKTNSMKKKIIGEWYVEGRKIFTIDKSYIRQPDSKLAYRVNWQVEPYRLYVKNDEDEFLFFTFKFKGKNMQVCMAEMFEWRIGFVSVGLTRTESIPWDNCDVILWVKK